MDKESRYLLQLIDANCSDCIYMVRDMEKKKMWDKTELHSDQVNASFRINYGKCTKFNKEVSFIPNHCQIETQECFKHRRDDTIS